MRFLREANEKLESIPQEFQSDPDIAKAIDLAQESSYTREELLVYDYYLDALSSSASLYDGYCEEGKAEVAKRMISKGKSLGEVCEMTELSMEVVQKLAKENA